MIKLCRSLRCSGLRRIVSIAPSPSRRLRHAISVSAVFVASSRSHCLLCPFFVMPSPS
ncbi:hypothetical protein DEO72_LG4g1330 [Vigna unguiculata]|uniref:Uncharacterized protein n=1 Tax=Vigna unguiculata TaxID=3917 RepID=A0A4D6LPP5_VIGUN|nr:hypothetical protein DEO72_LG4g1330 [Vigna unguiculata]